MPRAAAPLLPNEEENSLPANGDAQPEVFTTLRPSVAAAGAPETSTAATHHGMMDATDVVTAFLTNLSGGAACYDVDFGLVAVDAVNEELAEQFKSMRRLMAFSDAASWSVASNDAISWSESTIDIVATARTGEGDELSTNTQHFTLHIDVKAMRPIVEIVAGQRFNGDFCELAEGE